MENLEIEVLKDNRPLAIKTTDIYFKPKFFEKEIVYEKLGVKIFKKLLMSTLGRILRAAGADNISGLYFIGRGEGRNISNYETYTRVSEMVHMCSAMLFGNNLISNVVERNTGGMILGGVGLLVNGYPIILQ